MSLEILNNASSEQAKHLLRQCCTSETWVAHMAEARPYETAQSLFLQADLSWADLVESDYLQAFEGHPKIGDISSLKAKYANTKELASGEQSSVDEASDETLQRLAKGNTTYESKFGFIFLVCATGKSAEEMVELLEERLVNDRPTELINAAEEQRKIFHLRLRKLL